MTLGGGRGGGEAAQPIRTSHSGTGPITFHISFSPLFLPLFSPNGAMLFPWVGMPGAPWWDSLQNPGRILGESWENPSSVQLTLVFNNQLKRFDEKPENNQ